MAIASQPRCPLPGDSFLRRVYWARLVSSRAFRICSFSSVARPSGGTTERSSAARPPPPTKDPDSCSGRLIPPPCNAGMSRSGCPAWATPGGTRGGKGLFWYFCLSYEEAVDIPRLSDRVKSCGRACRDRLVQLVKHEQSRRASFFFEEKPHPGRSAQHGLELCQLTSEFFFYFLKVSI